MTWQKIQKITTLPYTRHVIAFMRDIYVLITYVESHYWLSPKKQTYACKLTLVVCEGVLFQEYSKPLVVIIFHLLQN